MLSSNKKITNLGLQFRKTDLIKKKKKEKQRPTGRHKVQVGSRDEQTQHFKGKHFLKGSEADFTILHKKTNITFISQNYLFFFTSYSKYMSYR